jgi:acyl-CoA thioesterase-2
MSVDLANLLSCLDLRQTAPQVLEGDNLDLEYRRVFGGQVLAQSIRAIETVADGKLLKSFTQHFPREGDVGQPMSYSTTTHQSGRTFAVVGVQATQTGKLVSQSTASLHVPEAGLERCDEAPDVGRPEDAVPTELIMVPWEVRVVDGIDLGSKQSHPARYSFWMRCPELPPSSRPDSPWTHQALLAHATDLTVIGTALLPIEGSSQEDTGTAFHTAVTTHSMWFHQPFRLDDWVLVDQTGPVLSRGRAFGRGDVWTTDGQLVASFAQESMIRLLGSN